MHLFSKLRGLWLFQRGRVDVSKRFDLIVRVGQGSMSHVYRARDRFTGKIVALKILDKDQTARLEARFQGLRRPTEGEIAEALRHPNIVQTFEHGVTTHGEQFLVMEYLDGSGLNYLVDTASPRLRSRRFHYLLQVARAVQYFHEQNYIHRDICPRNVLVDAEEQVKLIDFGLAVPNTSPFRAPGNRTGTYMAPELVRRQPTDQRIDVFSFGVTCYNVFTGSLPWDAGESLAQKILILNSPPRDIREARPDLDDALARCIMKGIASEPKERWPTIHAFLEALESLPKKDY